MKTFVQDKLQVKIFENRTAMGAAAATDIKARIAALLAEKAEINMIFAAAPSQNDVLLSLVEDKSIEWNRINAYHMDEYIGLDSSAPQCFGNFLGHFVDQIDQSGKQLAFLRGFVVVQALGKTFQKCGFFGKTHVWVPFLS